MREALNEPNLQTHQSPISNPFNDSHCQSHTGCPPLGSDSTLGRASTLSAISRDSRKGQVLRHTVPFAVSFIFTLSSSLSFTTKSLSGPLGWSPAPAQAARCCLTFAHFPYPHQAGGREVSRCGHWLVYTLVVIAAFILHRNSADSSLHPLLAEKLGTAQDQD